MSQSDQNPAAGSNAAKPKKNVYPKLSIRNKPGCEGMVSTGANVQVLLDGNKIPMVSFLKIELKPAKVAKVTMELYVELDAEVITEELKTVAEEGTALTMRGKHVAVRTLSNLEPAGIAFKKE